MHKQTLTLLLVVICFLCCLAFACAKSDTNVPQDQITRSALSHDTNPQVSDADLAAIAAGNTAFALKVFQLIDPSGTGNVVFSPYSITQAFALAAPGARGTTLSGIEQVLSFLPQDRLNPALNKLDLLLASEATGSVTGTGDQLPILKKANALWGQTGLPLLPAYLDTIAVNYDAGVHIVDFADAPEGARNMINAWVENQTNNRIQDLVPSGGVTSATRVFLTDALWFKANWAYQFYAQNTRDQTFYNHDGSTSSVPFMHATFTPAFVQADGSQAVDIPYAGGKFSMLVIMPDPGTFDAFLSSLTPTVLNDITTQLAYQEVELSLPKFSVTKAASMVAILRSLGMTEATDPAVADFSGIDGNRDLYISDVFHQAFISIDEHGTEAAAATAIGLAGAAAPSQPTVLTVDHPFLFMIREQQTGLVLFMGKVLAL